MEGSFSRLLVLAIGLAAVPICGLLFFDATHALARPGQDTRASKRFLVQFEAARAEVTGTDAPTTAELERHLERVKAIDASRTHKAVQRGYSNYIATIKRSIQERGNRDGTGTAEEAWRTAGMELDRTARRHAKPRGTVP